MIGTRPVTAVIWDYDGTLVDILAVAQRDVAGGIGPDSVNWRPVAMSVGDED